MNPVQSLCSLFFIITLTTLRPPVQELRSSTNTLTAHLHQYYTALPYILTADAAGKGSTKREDPYKVLGVPKNASLKEIKAAFRKLSLKYHPDRNPDEQSKEKYNEITKAHHILGSPKLKQLYDEQGFDAVDRYEATGKEQPDNFFSSFFGGDSHFRGPQKVQPTIINLRVPLVDLYEGTFLYASFTRLVMCSKLDSCLKPSPTCAGMGVRVVEQQMGPGFIMKNQVRDESCISRGKAWKPGCKGCPDGIKIQKAVDVTVDVEMGMTSGETIVFEGQGEESLGLETGDLILVIQEIADETFTRQGNDLMTTIYIDLKDALVGFAYDLKHLSKEKIKIAKDAVTYDGEIVKVHGQGMPVRGHLDSYGDLFVTVRIKYPKSLTAKQKELIEEALEDVKDTTHN